MPCIVLQKPPDFTVSPAGQHILMFIQSLKAFFTMSRELSISNRLREISNMKRRNQQKIPKKLGRSSNNIESKENFKETVINVLRDLR